MKPVRILPVSDNDNDSGAFKRWHEIRRRHGNAFSGGFLRGYGAGRRGEKVKCPYNDDGRTFSTAFARFWEEGYELGLEKRARDLEKP